MAADLDALLNRMLADADGKEDPATAPVGGGKSTPARPR